MEIVEEIIGFVFAIGLAYIMSQIFKHALTIIGSEVIDIIKKKKGQKTY